VLLGVGNLTEEERESIWDEISDEVSALLQGERELLSGSVVPFDAASSISIEQQRSVTTVHLYGINTQVRFFHRQSNQI